MLKRLLRSSRGTPSPAATELPTAIRHRNLNLPVKRSNEGLQDDATYLNSAADQIGRIAKWLPADGTIVDFGCGQGRLLNGLLYTETSFGGYCGVDIDKDAIAWCVTHLSYPSVNASFIWYNGNNARYNADGIAVPDIPSSDNAASVIFANSVFSHLEPEDVSRYADILKRKLTSGGAFYLTAFVEEGVEPVAYDPKGYYDDGPTPRRPLTRVRYEKEHFLSLVTSAGLKLVEYHQNGIARTGQSELIFQVADGS